MVSSQVRALHFMLIIHFMMEILKLECALAMVSSTIPTARSLPASGATTRLTALAATRMRLVRSRKAPGVTTRRLLEGVSRPNRDPTSKIDAACGRFSKEILKST